MNGPKKTQIELLLCTYGVIVKDEKKKTIKCRDFFWVIVIEFRVHTYIFLGCSEEVGDSSIKMSQLRQQTKIPTTTENNVKWIERRKRRNVQKKRKRAQNRSCRGHEIWLKRAKVPVPRWNKEKQLKIPYSLVQVYQSLIKHRVRIKLFGHREREIRISRKIRGMVMWWIRDVK